MLIDLEKAGFSALYVMCEDCDGKGGYHPYDDILCENDTSRWVECRSCGGTGKTDNRDTVILELATAIVALEASLKAVGVPLLELKGTTE